MTTFSNKLLYSKGHLDHHSIVLKGSATDTEITFRFKDPIHNVVAVEAVQGMLTSGAGSGDTWVYIRCPLTERRLEGKYGTEFDIPLALVKTNYPFALNHNTRYFSKPKDSVKELTLSFELASSASATSLSLSAPWIIQLEITTVRIATHTDWRNIPEKAEGESGQFDKTRDDIEPGSENKALTIKASRSPREEFGENSLTRKKKKKKNTSIDSRKKSQGPEPQGKVASSTLGSSVVKGTVGVLAAGTALALGLKFK